MRTAESLLRSYPEEVRALAHEAGRLIGRLLPDVKETVDSAAPVIGYSCGAGYRGLVCTLILSKAGVKLGLVGGAELDDPYGLLQGSGKVHRYVQLHGPEDLRQRGVGRLIRAAHVACQKRLKSTARR